MFILFFLFDMVVLHLITIHNFNFIEGLDYQGLDHKLKQSFNYVIENQKHIEDIYVVTVFDEDRIALRVINIDINNKFKYYGVSINE